VKTFAVLASVLVAGCASSARTARNDVIIQWNQQAMATGGPHLERTLAMTHLAMFDAANAVDRRYAPYLALPAAPAGASAEAAAAAAAHGVLVRLFPDERETLGAALERSLADVPDGRRRAQSVEYGHLIAQRMYEARLADTIAPPPPPPAFGTAPGDYRDTEPEQPQANDGKAGHTKPFGLESASQFRPGPPPALTSARYARDLEEVRQRGGSASSRTADQEQAARWHAEPGSAQVNRIARTEAATDGRSLVEHARLFALLNLAVADADVSAFDAQYTYRFWRPVTAIRQADFQASPDTRQGPVWSPFLPTPPSPEYPSSLATIQAAGARVLTAYFGRFHSFRATSGAMPGMTRAYANFDAFADEGATASILSGMQFRTSVDEGRQMGAKVADWLVDHFLVSFKGH
jgi:hypothetical protein